MLKLFEFFIFSHQSPGKTLTRTPHPTPHPFYSFIAVNNNVREEEISLCNTDYSSYAIKLLCSCQATQTTYLITI